jgi:hypothetical protein
MPIHRLLENCAMGPDEIRVLVTAYDRTLRELCLKDSNDPLAETIAKKVFEIGQRGVKDPTQICKLAIKELRVG